MANGLRYNLSAKQLALLDTFIKKAEQLEAQIQTPVSLAAHTEAQLLCDLADTYIGMTAKKGKDIQILRAAIGSGIGLSEEQLEAGRKAVSGELKRYNKLKKWYTPGMLVQYRAHGQKVEMVLVVDGPQIDDFGNNARGYYGGASKSMRIPVIVDGRLVHACASHISRYTKKQLKAMGAI